MAMILSDDKVVFEKKVYENELEDLKKHLASHQKLSIDMSACDDMHGAIIQLILVHHAMFESDFIFNDKQSTFKMAIEGFRNVENDCN
jgi:hypothetical protein